MTILGVPSTGLTTSHLNGLRAGVLGANDGIVSVAAIVVGVAAATDSLTALVMAGVAGLSAGALSMASGEYVSVSSQRDAERAMLHAGRTVGDAGGPAMTDAEHGDDTDLVNPWQAAWSSFFAFVVGGLLPLAAVLVVPAGARVPVTFAAVVLALALTGWVSARLGGARVLPAVRRNVLGGALAMAVTYGVGALVGVAL